MTNITYVIATGRRNPTMLIEGLTPKAVAGRLFAAYGHEITEIDHDTLEVYLDNPVTTAEMVVLTVTQLYEEGTISQCVGITGPEHSLTHRAFCLLGRLIDRINQCASKGELSCEMAT